MKNIIYIDNYYPYSYKGETFLQNEIDFLSKINTDVKRYIYPVDGKQITNENINYADKVNLIEPLKRNILKKILGLLLTIFNKDLYKEIFVLIKTRRFNVKNLKKCVNFIEKGTYNSKIIINYIKKNIEKNDNIVLYSYWMNLQAYIATIVKKKLYKEYRIKAISRCHRFDVYEYANQNYIPCRYVILKNLDNIYSISKDAINYIDNKYKLNNLKCSVSMLGTFDNGINISPKKTTLKILSCSWMRPVKRINYIYEAIKDTQFPIEWVHIGDGEEFEFIKELIESNNNKKLSCKLLGGIPNKEIIDYYKNNDINIFINVSESEGVPVSIMEAMSFGKIILATNTGGVSEIVENGINGYLLPVDLKEKDLYEIIKKIYKMSNEEYIVMSNSSRKIWEQKCNAEKNYSSFEGDMLND